VASSRSKVFHQATCSGAREIKPENRLVFPNRKAAVASGRTPAKDCNP
jgi:methylphosphotriester-DNA--protein-cysteine methyltransferase